MAEEDREAPIPFATDEIEWLTFNRGITSDDKGRRVYTGLTFAESKEYFALKGPGSLDFKTMGYEEHNKKTNRYLELHGKHEMARIAMCVAVAELEDKKPTLN